MISPKDIMPILKKEEKEAGEKALTTQVIKTEFKSLAIPHRQIIFNHSR